MEFSHWLSLFSICLLGAMSPGPSLAVVMNNTLRGGRGEGYATALAHGCGVALYGLLTVTGLAVLISRSTGLFVALQILGAAYLLYLGGKSLTSRGSRLPATEGGQSARSAALNGFLVAFINPKIAIFMLALFDHIKDPTGGPMEKGIMVATVGITDASWYSLIVVLISRRTFMERLQQSAALIERLFGVILILLALGVLLRTAGLV